MTEPAPNEPHDFTAAELADELARYGELPVSIVVDEFDVGDTVPAETIRVEKVWTPEGWRVFITGLLP